MEPRRKRKRERINAMNIAHLGVIADEGKNALKSYKGVEFRCGSKKLVFDTGNFPDDFVSAVIVVLQG